MLRADGQPALEFVSAEPSGAAKGAPILFLHGAFGGAWMWNEHFLAHFANRGRRVHAVSLRGHGQSEGREAIKDASFDDYIADLRRALAEMPEPPLLVGHSLGALVAQRVLGKEKLAGLALVAPAPPEGLGFIVGRIALSQPVVWFNAFLRSTTGGSLPVVEATRRAWFAGPVRREKVARYSAATAPESPLALAQAHMPAPIVPAIMTATPAMVLVAGDDRVVPRSAALRTAFYHGARVRDVENVGHAFMLDTGWERAARSMLDWMESEGI